MGDELLPNLLPLFHRRVVASLHGSDPSCHAHKLNSFIFLFFFCWKGRGSFQTACSPVLLLEKGCFPDCYNRNFFKSWIKCYLYYISIYTPTLTSFSNALPWKALGPSISTKIVLKNWRFSEDNDVRARMFKYYTVFIYLFFLARN